MKYIYHLQIRPLQLFFYVLFLALPRIFLSLSFSPCTCPYVKSGGRDEAKAAFLLIKSRGSFWPLKEAAWLPGASHISD